MNNGKSPEIFLLKYIYNGQKLCIVISRFIFPLFSWAYLSNARNLASFLSYISVNITQVSNCDLYKLSEACWPQPPQLSN